MTNTDVAVSRDVDSGLITDGYIAAAGRILIECRRTDSRVSAAGSIGSKRYNTDGRILIARVAIER